MTYFKSKSFSETVTDLYIRCTEYYSVKSAGLVCRPSRILWVKKTYTWLKSKPDLCRNRRIWSRKYSDVSVKIQWNISMSLAGFGTQEATSPAASALSLSWISATALVASCNRFGRKCLHACGRASWPQRRNLKATLGKPSHPMRFITKCVLFWLFRLMFKIKWNIMSVKRITF